MSDWKLIGIPLAAVDKALPYVLEWLSEIEVTTARRMSLNKLVNGLRDSRMQLWFVIEGESLPSACVVTEIMDYTDTKLCNVVLASGGGNARKWTPFVIEKIEGFARENGCEGVEIFGRKGWLKLLPDYEVEHYVLKKEFKDG